MSTLLRTPRLRLDPYRREDHEVLYRLWTSAEVRRYLFDDERIAEDFVAVEIEGSRRSFPETGHGQWCIRRHDDDDVIGFAGLRPFGGSDEPQLLYGLEGGSWGKGYATEAASAVLDYAFQELAMPRVLASTDAPNLASIAVMRRLGMRPLDVRQVNGQPTPFFEMPRDRWVVIRPYDPRDFADVEALWREVLPSSQTYNAPAESARRMHDHAPELFFVAARDGSVIGTVLAGWDGHRGWIYSMAVSPRHQRRGIGTRLLHRAVAELERRDCPKINLQVRAANQPVVDFYRRHGFEVEDRVSLGRRGR